MTPNRKDRLVSFRLSDPEYRALREFCLSNGIHNLSEFARRAVSRLVEAQIEDSVEGSIDRTIDISAHLSSLDDSMRRLTDALGQLSRLIEGQTETSGLTEH